MEIEPISAEGVLLFREGAIALAKVEKAGIRIDVPRLAATEKELEERIRGLRRELESSELWKIWKRRFGAKANLTSRDQLAAVVFDEMGYEPWRTTESGKNAADEESLSRIDDPDVSVLLRMQRMLKAKNTYLKGIKQEVVGDRIHPVFNLHTARSFRSSSDSPNFQNFPVRDPEIGELIRRHFIASPESVLVESDFKGIEVAISACYHKDPNFISYITTPGKDMHRDTAAELFLLPATEVTKELRYIAKNKFVFAQFYGDFYVSCARSLWDWIERGGGKLQNGMLVRDHLRQKGITERGACDPGVAPRPGTYEALVKKVEDSFWLERFNGYRTWKRRWYDEYLEKGYFDLLTGFRVTSVLPRNSAVNYPIQGTAFHCLLWTLIQVQREMERQGMRSLIVGQIHDSLIADVKIDELRDYLEILEQVTKVALRRHFKWLIVPLEVECEVAPPGKSWFEKRPVKFSDGRFWHPTKPVSTKDPKRLLEIIAR